VDDEAVGVRIAAEAKDGKANAELVEFLAAVLNVKRSAVTVERGSKSHDKLVSIAGITPAQAHKALLVSQHS